MKLKKLSFMLIFVMIVNMLFTFTTFAADGSTTHEIVVETNSSNSEWITEDYNTFDTDQYTVTSDRRSSSGTSASQSSITLSTQGAWFEYDVYTKTAQNVKLSLAAKYSGSATNVTVYVNGTIYALQTVVTSTDLPANTNKGSWTECAVVPLTASKNTVKVMNDGAGSLIVEEFKLEKTNEAVSDVILTRLDNTAGVTFNGSLTGTAGANYLDITAGGKGAANVFTYNVVAPKAGTYTLELNIGYAEASCSFDVWTKADDITSDIKCFGDTISKGTGNKTTRAWLEVCKVSLAKGTNTVKIALNNASTISASRLTPWLADIVDETAEFKVAGAYVDRTSTSTQTTGYIQIAKDGYFVYKVNAPASQRYTLSISSRGSVSANTKWDVYVGDNLQLAGVTAAVDNVYSDTALGVISLEKGENTIKIVKTDSEVAYVYINALSFSHHVGHRLTGNSTEIALNSGTIEDWGSEVTPDTGNVNPARHADGWYEFRVYTETAQSYELSFDIKTVADNYAVYGGMKLSVFVNGNVQITDKELGDSAADFEYITFGTVDLSAGENVIRITRNADAGFGNPYTRNCKFEVAMSIESFDLAGGTATATINKISAYANDTLWLVIAQYSDDDECPKMEKCTLTVIKLADEAVGSKDYTATIDDYNSNLTTKAFLVNGSTLTPLADDK